MRATHCATTRPMAKKESDKSGVEKQTEGKPEKPYTGGRGQESIKKKKDD